MPVSVVAAQTQIKVGWGIIKSIEVVVAGAAGTVNDVAAAGTGNPILGIPATLGWSVVYQFPLPFGAGLCVNPGSGQTLVVDWS